MQHRVNRRLNRRMAIQPGGLAFFTLIGCLLDELPLCHPPDVLELSNHKHLEGQAKT